ncbi:MAG: class I SAM-dependent methyltransferase [Wenzhouxiangellaceae bacterium]|nr:class I SAM-dependent methyltransferase [Wenzhouxiangellaceae bacterium]MBS3745699.1 class I SAM-dependent methyltransferase [Wenzhouxiangellaceae bacterium]
MTDWYTDEDFWRKFGPLMFGDEQFSEAAAQVPALLARIGLEQGAALDLGCGPGRHALPLARAGLGVTAVDTSPYLLDDLRRRADEAGLTPEIVRADMREFVRPAAFDAVVVMWTSFGYFEKEADHDRALSNIAESLKPGGIAVLDLLGLETLCRTLEPVHLTEHADGSLLVERPVLIEHNTRLENEWILIRGDRAERATFSHRVWSAGEIARLVEAAGLQLEAIDGDLEGTPYDFESERMYVFARKS